MAKPTENNRTSASADATQTDDEARFTFDDLLAELKNEHQYRRDSALELAYHAKLLVDLRAAANGTSFADEWKTIFDRKKLDAEMDGEDPKRARAAFDVIDDVNNVEALRYADDCAEPPTLEERLWAIEMRARIRKRCDELRALRGFPVKSRSKN
jgi:hypothetical protein